MFRKRGAPVFLELMNPKGEAHAARPGKAPPAPPNQPAPPAPPPAPLFEQAKGPGSSTSLSQGSAAAPSAGAAAVGSGSPGSAGPGVATQFTPRPIVVEPKPKPAYPNDAASTPSARELLARGDELLGEGWRRWMVFAAAAVVVLLVGYVLGHFVRGREADRREAEIVGRFGPGEQVTDPLKTGASPNGGGSDSGHQGKPEVRPSPGGSGNQAPSPAPSPVPPRPEPLSDSLKPGNNYLIVATLMRKEAEEAAQFLSSNKVPAVLVTASGKAIDPSSPEANNVQWMVVVLRGYSQAEYKAQDVERRDLMNKVQLLGRKWKSENKRAPTDFGQVYWKLFKG